jgi:hypothetical protein
MLEPLSLLRPRGKNCQRKFSDQIPTHSGTRNICAHGESRLDAIYEHFRRDASALERLGNEDCVLWLIQVVVVFDAL